MENLLEVIDLLRIAKRILSEKAYFQIVQIVETDLGATIDLNLNGKSGEIGSA